MADALSSLRVKLENSSTKAYSEYSIYRIPRALRKENHMHYRPLTVSIGPYYHGIAESQKMEEVKLSCMQSLVKRHHVTLECYFSTIAKVQKEARDCYAEAIQFKVKEVYEFIQMLVLDGCFIIELLEENLTYVEGYIPPSLTNSLYRDLILLENQIPFFVLCKLFDLIKGPNKHELLKRRVLYMYKTNFPGNIVHEATLSRSSGEIKHILDLVHSNWFPHCLPHWFPHPLGCDTTREPDRLTIPSAELLKDANVNFKKKEYESRGTTVFDVEFSEEKGVMLMPSLIMTDKIECFLRNLIAYEQFFPSDKPTPVTYYAILLDCLINRPKDVQILSQQKIIENFLGSDIAVVNFVNRLTQNVDFKMKFFRYKDIFDRVNKYHQKPWNRAVAVYHRDYFNSPWAYVSFFAAVLLLLLTAAQTLFAAFEHFN